MRKRLFKLDANGRWGLRRCEVSGRLWEPGVPRTPKRIPSLTNGVESHPGRRTSRVGTRFWWSSRGPALKDQLILIRDGKFSDGKDQIGRASCRERP